jgi:hypothetical protein
MTDGRLLPLVDTAPRELAIIIARGSDDFGIAVLHAGEAVAFLTPAQAESEAAELRRLAAVCRRPGKVPRA